MLRSVLRGYSQSRASHHFLRSFLGATQLFNSPAFNSLRLLAAVVGKHVGQQRVLVAPHAPITITSNRTVKRWRVCQPLL